MTNNTERFIGDTNTFAIRYVPGYTGKSKTDFFANCHLVLGGQIIGDKEEFCYLNTWKYSLEMLKNRIRDNLDSIWHTEFNNKCDREVFELIWKANQLEEEFKVEYKHLPILDNTVWSNCYISLDETTDAYLIAMVGDKEKIKFLWEGWRTPCPDTNINKLYSVIVDRQFVLETMEQYLLTIENEYLGFPTR